MGDCWGNAVSVIGFRDLRQESCWVPMSALIPNQPRPSVAQHKQLDNSEANQARAWAQQLETL